MIKTIEKPCPGDCSVCPYPNEIIGFDMYGCVLNQTLQRTIRMEKEVQALKDTINGNHSENVNEKVIIKHTEEQEDGTSNEILSEQDG